MSEVLSVGDIAPESIVMDIHEQPVNLADLWQQGPTFVLFLRHFGCIFCRERLTQLEKYYPELEEVGLNVVAIGLGEAKHAERYCGNLAPSANCFANEDASVYYDYGFHRIRLGEMLSFDFVKNTLRAFTSVGMQDETTGDIRMIGGDFIIDADGVIQYAYYSKTAGDHPSFEEIIRVAEELM